MVWEILLYFVAYAIDYISNYVVTFLWGSIGLYAQAIIIPKILPEQYVSRELRVFLQSVLQLMLLRFLSSIGGVTILGLWGHSLSWVIFLLFLVVREFYTHSRYRISGPTGSIITRGYLTGGLIGLALVGFFTAIIIL